MKFNSQQFVLKSELQITVREVAVTEALSLLDLKRSYIDGSATIPMTFDEYHQDEASEKQLIQDFRDSSNSILLVAEYNGELIGNLDITGSRRSKMAHTGMIGMGIKTGWRNQGLGKALLSSAVEWAKANPELEVLWLDVYASNELGYNLYVNTGFEVSGVIKDFFKEGQSRIDKVQMFQYVGN